MSNLVESLVKFYRHKQPEGLVALHEPSISEFDKNHLSAIAFVHYADPSDKSNHEIINVQKVKLGENQDWD